MKISNEFVLREIEGDYIIVPTGKEALQFNGIITLNEVGVVIWELLQKETTCEEIVQTIMETYEVEEAEVQEDVQEFLEKLLAEGILKGTIE
jgi:hypothetical protein